MIELEKKIAQQTLSILKKKSWNTFSLEQVLKSVKVKKTNISIVVITNNRLVLNPKFDEAKTLGIIKKITKGFAIPPVK